MVGGGLEMSSPRVTVLMPVYNAENYLDEAIDSILKQTFNNFEFLIINDGSTDKSVKIIEKYKDSRIKLINNEKNKGLVYTLNKGLSLAKGEYIARMDADDISLFKRLETQVSFLDENPEIGIVGTYVEFFGENIKRQVWRPPTEMPEIKVSLFFGSTFAHPTVMIRRKLFKTYKLKYNESYKSAEDYGLWQEAEKHFKLKNIPEVHLKYRISESSITNTAERKLDERYSVLKKIYLKGFSNIDYYPTEEELEMFFYLCSNKRMKIKKMDLNVVSTLFDNILKQNEKTQYYDREILTKYIFRKWLTIGYYKKSYLLNPIWFFRIISFLLKIMIIKK